MYLSEHLRDCMSNKEEVQRNRERETTLHSGYSDTTALGLRNVLRAWATRERTSRPTVRTTVDYIDFDFRRHAHLAFSGSAHSCRSRLAAENIGPVALTKSKTEPQKEIYYTLSLSLLIQDDLLASFNH